MYVSHLLAARLLQNKSKYPFKILILIRNNLVANIGPCSRHLVLKQCSNFSQSIYPIICSSIARTGCSNKFSLSANQKNISSVELQFESRTEICVILLEGTPNTVKQKWNWLRQLVKL